MLLIAPESLKLARTLTDVARGLSLVPGYFATTGTLEGLLLGRSRRLVLLTADEVRPDVVSVLCEAPDTARIGIIVAADPDSFAGSDRQDLLDALSDHDNIEWIDPDFDAEWLASAARQCRRHMLEVPRESLVEALDDGQFLIKYQPKVRKQGPTDWETREAEALIRWRRPGQGLVGPLEFLPEAEAYDLIGPISDFVLTETGRQLGRWAGQGLELSACINLSSSLLGDTGIASRYASIVAELGLDCSRFTFEITERDLGDRRAPHLRTLDALREQGFRICLDDFRVAATSLGAFESLPFDEIKIQASALKRAEGDRVAEQVLAAVTGLAHSLGISVCVAGIEDLETFEFLKSIEYDKLQGFLISEAVMPEIVQKVYSTAVEAVA